MLIMFLAPDVKGRSGWSRYASDLGKALIRRGHTLIAVVAEPSPAPFCREIVMLAPDLHYLGNPIRCWWHAKKLRRHLAKLQPDVIHFIAEPDALLLPYLGKLKAKTVMTAHSTYAVVPLKAGYFTSRLMRAVYHKLDAVISVSVFTKNVIEQTDAALFREAKLKSKITVLHNAIDLLRARPELNEKKKDSMKRIVGVGAVKNRKGYVQAIDACAMYRDRVDDKFIYEIFGSFDHDQNYVATLRHQIHALGLEKNVKLRGSVTDAELEKAYANADLFLLLSLQEGYHAEGFGLVFLEANAWGIPVIGPNTGGCPEAINSGRSGYICDPRDPAAVAERMKDILVKNTIKPEDCLAWAKKHDVRELAQQVEKLYEGRD